MLAACSSNVALVAIPKRPRKKLVFVRVSAINGMVKPPISY